MNGGPTGAPTANAGESGGVELTTEQPKPTSILTPTTHEIAKMQSGISGKTIEALEVDSC